MCKPTVYNRIRSKARKKHKCCECGGIIEKGELYFRHSGIWDREAMTHKVCSDCESLRLEIENKGYCEEGFIFTCLRDEAEEAGLIKQFEQIVANRA